MTSSNIRRTTKILAGFALISLSYLTPHAALADEETGPYRQRSDAQGSSVATVVQQLLLSSDPQYSQPTFFNANDDKNRLTAQANPASDAVPYVDWAHCAADRKSVV